MYNFRREGQAAQRSAEALIVLATEHGFPWYIALGTVNKGIALAEQGQLIEAIAQLRQGLNAMEATGGEITRSMYLTRLAEASGRVGEVEDGLATLTEASAFIAKNGDRFYEAEIHPIRGELLLKSDARRSREVETCFRTAIDIARRESAKSLRGCLSHQVDLREPEGIPLHGSVRQLVARRAYRLDADPAQS